MPAARTTRFGVGNPEQHDLVAPLLQGMRQRGHRIEMTCSRRKQNAPSLAIDFFNPPGSDFERNRNRSSVEPRSLALYASIQWSDEAQAPIGSTSIFDIYLPEYESGTTGCALSIQAV